MEKELTFLLSLYFWWTICSDIFYVSTSFIFSVCLSVDTDKEQLTHQRKRERLRRLQSLSEALSLSRVSLSLWSRDGADSEQSGGYKENIVWCHYWYYDLRYPHPPPPSSTKYQIDKNRMKRTAHYFIYIQPVPKPSISWKIEEKSSIISFTENFSQKIRLISNHKESYVFRGVEISSVINKFQR